MILPVANMKDRRKAAGLSLRELAILSGITKSHLSRVENGHLPMTAFIAQSISVPLKTPWFLFFENHESLKFWGEIKNIANSNSHVKHKL